MRWFQYVLAYASGFFLADFVPHFVSAVLGMRFPSPFSDPPAVGLSSPEINVLVAFVYLAVAYALFRRSKVQFSDAAGMSAVYLGMLSCGVILSVVISANENLNL